MLNKFCSACVAAALTTSVASAAPIAEAHERVITGNDKNLSAETMETGRAQTLKIRKLAPNPYDELLPGDKPFGGVEGLTFRLSKVQGLDVTTGSGREAAKQFDVARARQAGFSEIREQATDGRGIAVFDDLRPALYLIEEFAPDDDHDWRLSSPRLVLLPLGDVTGEEFSYENVVVTKPDPGDLPPTPPATPPGDPGTPPETPGIPSEPGKTPNVPDESRDQPDGSGKTDGNDGELALTGANVIWALVTGGVLILLGYLLIRRRKEN